MMKKKKLKKSVRIFIILISLLLVLIGGINLYKSYTNNITDNKQTDIKKDIKEEKEEEEEEIPEKKISLLATGDAVIHSGIYKAAKTNDGYDFNSMLSMLSDIIPKYDISFINQETPFADKEPSNYPTFNTPHEWGDALINVGFNMVSLSNNHSMDQGEQGVLDTLNYWNTTNVYHNGMASSFKEQTSYEIEEKNGITYAMLAYTKGTNGINVPSGKEYLVNVYSYELAKKDIEKLRDNVDVLIISMHWGDEYQASPNDYQSQVAQELASLDVDIVLGNHPHWIQPIEYIDNTLVIYSMGNFISNQMSIAHKYPYTESVTVGAMVTMDIIKKEDIIIDNISVELIYSYLSPNNEYLVIPFSKMNESYASNYIDLYEEHKTRITSLSDLVSVVPLN